MKHDGPTSVERILKAAVKEFSQYGYDGARIDRIASWAKINKAMIYYHFKNKEALYERILIDIYEKIYAVVIGDITEVSPSDQIYDIISRFVNFTGSIDPEFGRLMLREISSGGKYFKKLAIPKLILPTLSVVVNLYSKGKKENRFREIDPVYTHMQVIGAVVFFNILRITLEGTDLHKMVFRENHLVDYRNNLISIIKNGIEKHE
ncbi:MAG: TetR/AcrR family transcriptional regulator [Spirochaetes bacterium]|jgi:AcrR family transcriptional regulator|nr:TetR/AcrR family transcriptional regulator [Spirochaetota bacterium]